MTRLSKLSTIKDMLNHLIKLNIETLLIDLDNPLEIAEKIHNDLMSGKRSESEFSNHILLSVKYYELYLSINN
jgi:hypothetical protein